MSTEEGSTVVKQLKSIQTDLNKLLKDACQLSLNGVLKRMIIGGEFTPGGTLVIFLQANETKTGVEEVLCINL